MSPDALILKDGLPVFHRTYGEKSLKNIDLAGGFFQALLQFSTHEVGESLESIQMSDSIVHFKIQEEFTFILIEKKDSVMPIETLTTSLNQIMDRFFKAFPGASQWGGDLAYFESFSAVCDQVLQTKSKVRGFPLLLKLVIKPFLLSPIQHVTPILGSNEQSFYSIQRQLGAISKKIDAGKFRSWLRNTFVINLHETSQVAYIVGFNVELKGKDISHLLCYIFDEADWQVFYQLIQQFYGKFQRMLPELINYIVAFEKNPTSPESQQNKRKIQETLSVWADIDQYLGDMEASIAETFFKSKISRDALSDDVLRAHFYDLFKMFGKDFEKLLFAVIIMQRILVLGQDRQKVEQSLTALLSYYLHPSVSLWSEIQTEKLLVGGPPTLANAYPKNVVIADLDNNRVLGGENNDFCTQVLAETEKYSRNVSVTEGRAYFQKKISSIFETLGGLLKVLSRGDTQQDNEINSVMQSRNMAEKHLLTRISRNINPILNEILQKSLDSKSRFQDFFGDITR